MSSVDQALETQLQNIQKRTGKTLNQLFGEIDGSGRTKHGEIRDWLKAELGMGHGDANTVVHFYLKSKEAPSGAGGGGDVADEIYAGPKAALRPIHDAAMAAIGKLGEFEIAPKKGYLSLRRKKQFAMIGPGTKGRLELGLNMKGVEGTERLLTQPPGGMCQYKVFLTTASEVDAELVGWLRTAYDAAG